MSSVEAPELVPVLRSARDRYAVLGTIGHGASAIVLKARDLELDEVVALKVLAPSVARDPAVVERLKREIRIARRVRHPNVARVFDLEEWDGRLCISMEYIEGHTLEQRLRSGPIPWIEVVPLLMTLALTLESAHGLGVVHRDLKPANVVLDRLGHPYILDFGIALGPGGPEPGSRDVIHGSPTYMAPERWRGIPGIAGSDLYSLGVVAYEMLAGRPPFRADSLRVLMSQHLHAPPPPLTSIVAGLPVGLDRLVLHLLAKQPEERPASAAELQRLLRLFAPSCKLSTAAVTGVSRGKVLVVDDEALIRGMLAELLRKRGVEVLVAKDGREGVAAAIASKPDLILLDISMPELDGVASLRAIKADPVMAGRPIVMLSGNTDPQYPEVSRGLGAVAFLNKPINADVLDLVLDKYLG